MEKEEFNFQNLSSDQLKVLCLCSKLKECELISDLSEVYHTFTSKNESYLKNKQLAEESALKQFLLYKELFPYKPSHQCSVTPPVIVYVDGVFDIIHSGHFNAIRQAKKLSDILYVGVNGDEDVFKAKGPTLMNIEERTILASACKWGDKVITDTPYTPTIEFLDKINAHFCAHGDDISPNENGIDAYHEIKMKGRMKIFKRTEGISTTDLIGRLLALGSTNNQQIYRPLASKFLSTGWRLREFCNEKYPISGQKVVYIDGAWDILHVGHIEALSKAKSKGDFLYVGVYDDTTVSSMYKGKSSVLSLQERTCNLLALKYVDDVVIGSPRKINEDLIKSLGVNIFVADESNINEEDKDENDPYDVPKKLGIFESIKCNIALNNNILIKRLYDNKDVFVAKYLKKNAKEEDYYKNQKKEMAEI